MVWGNAEVLSPVGPGLPFGKFVAVLEAGVQDEDRATPDV